MTAVSTGHLLKNSFMAVVSTGPNLTQNEKPLTIVLPVTVIASIIPIRVGWGGTKKPDKVGLAEKTEITFRGKKKTPVPLKPTNDY